MKFLGVEISLAQKDEVFDKAMTSFEGGFDCCADLFVYLHDIGLDAFVDFAERKGSICYDFVNRADE
jgi:hypothetical protein